MSTSALPLKILEHVPMGRDAYCLRLERPDWTWNAGQVIGLLGKGPHDQRDYTIASGIHDETLDVIYRLIPHGILTPFLREKKSRRHAECAGPVWTVHAEGPRQAGSVLRHRDRTRPLPRLSAQ